MRRGEAPAEPGSCLSKFQQTRYYNLIVVYRCYLITNIIRIGDSSAIIIPKIVIEQCGFNDKVKLQVKDRELIITPARKPREGWAEAFKKWLKKEKMMIF